MQKVPKSARNALVLYAIVYDFMIVWDLCTLELKFIPIKLNLKLFDWK